MDEHGSGSRLQAGLQTGSKVFSGEEVGFMQV